MTAMAEKLRVELTTLSATERGELAHFLIQSLNPESDTDADNAWDVELERRSEEIKTDRAIGEPAGKVFLELQAKYA